MIHPEQRGMLTDALTPPPGFVFHSGVATTYSLDLLTLLTLPLHLVWLGSPNDEASNLDPLRIVESLNRTATKLTVYCQRGQMQIPRTASPLFALMEGMIFESLAPHGGAFHPKVWLLRFIDPSGGASRLRLIVLSRNLTDDRSWDISVNLDGIVGSRAIDINRPLKLFFKQLQKLSGKPATPGRQADLDVLQHDVARCDWEVPGDFDSLRFHVLGMGSKPTQWMPEHDKGKWDELGVVSPFVRGGALKALADLCASPIFLVTRPDQLDQLAPGDRSYFQNLKVLNAEGNTAEQEDDTGSAAKGLHAKVFAAKRAWHTHIFLGSANATNAALLNGSNVEFMVELVGKSSRVGHPAYWTGPEGLGDFLIPYTPGASVKSDQAVQDSEALEKLRKQLCSTGLQLKCSLQEDGWLLVLLGGGQVERDGASIFVWPLSVRFNAAVLFDAKPGVEMLRLGVFPESELTSFTGFSLRLGEQKLEFALDLAVKGLPDSRDMAVLRAAMVNREGFTRYLLLLLGNWTAGKRPGASGTRKKGKVQGDPGAASPPLFEMLTWAFAHDPERLVQINRIVERVGKEGADTFDDIVPSDFQRVWKTFKQAMTKKTTR